MGNELRTVPYTLTIEASTDATPATRRLTRDSPRHAGARRLEPDDHGRGNERTQSTSPTPPISRGTDSRRRLTGAPLCRRRTTGANREDPKADPLPLRRADLDGAQRSGGDPSTVCGCGFGRSTRDREGRPQGHPEDRGVKLGCWVVVPLRGWFLPV